MAIGVLVCAQLQASASGLTSEETATEALAETDSETTEEVTENSSYNTENQISEENFPAENTSEDTTSSFNPVDDQTETTTTEMNDNEKLQEELAELLKDENAEAKGVVYYCNAYAYDQEVEYLKVYREYILDVIQASKSMYEAGEITEIELKEYEAQKAMIDAQIEVAKNNAEYYRSYLKQNHLDYSDYKIKKIKEIHDADYYTNENKKLDYMTVAEFVKEYKNALAYIDAKNAEIEVKELKERAAKALYDSGEISKIEFGKQKVALGQAKYELEQYYSKMNVAYISLKEYCGEPVQ